MRRIDPFAVGFILLCILVILVQCCLSFGGDVWIRGYPIPTQVDAWLDNFEEHGNPEGWGVIIVADSHLVKYRPSVAIERAKRCRKLGVPYQLSLRCRPESGPGFGQDDLKIAYWWDKATWEWCAKLVDELAPHCNGVIVLDMEGYTYLYPEWIVEAQAVADAIVDLRAAEKSKGPAGRDDAKLGRLTWIEQTFRSGYMAGTRKQFRHPPALLEVSTVDSMQPLVEAVKRNRLEPWLMPGGLDSAWNRELQYACGATHCDESDFNLCRDYLAGKPDVWQRVAAMLVRQKRIENGGGRFMPGTTEDYLTDKAKALRTRMSVPVWVFPGHTGVSGIGSPEWSAQ